MTASCSAPRRTVLDWRAVVAPCALRIDRSAASPMHTKHTAPFHRGYPSIQEPVGTLAKGAILVVVGLGSTAERFTGAASLAGILEPEDSGCGVDGFAVDGVDHPLLQRHREHGQAGRVGSPVPQWWVGRILFRGRHRVLTWIVTGDKAAVAGLCGLDTDALAGGEVDTAVAAAWLDDGIAPAPWPCWACARC
jgi:hypothetical protein